MKVGFLASNRVHLARQQILLRELRKYFEVCIFEYKSEYNDIVNTTIDITCKFRDWVIEAKPDLMIFRGDRFEVLGPAIITTYFGIRIAHIEGGDKSGAIDNRVRNAITALSDIHFATNKESYSRLIAMGTDPDWTFNYGSLDVEYAKSIKTFTFGEYIVICQHPMPGEDPAVIEKIVKDEFKGKVYTIKSNSDNGTPYGNDQYTAENYIKLIGEAKCLVGNSSSFLKEASIFGTPVVNIGERQRNRLRSENVKDVPFDSYQILHTLRMQLNAKYKPSTVYYQESTSLKIVNKIKEFLSYDVRNSSLPLAHLSV